MGRARAGAGRSLAFLLPTQGMAQLAVKVLSLTVKTASKPLANQFQAYMLSHPFVRGKAIEGAQVLHKWNVSLSRASQDKKGKAFVGKLSDEKAMGIASKFLSETFIYVVAGGLLLYEYDRGNKREEKKKEDKEKRKKRKETKRLEHLQREDVFQKGVLQRLERLESLEKERSVGGGRRWW